VWSIYDQAAAVAGYRSGPEQRGYLIRCHVAPTEEKALRNARQFMWMQGELIGLQHPVWATPSGYLGTWARRGLAEIRAGYRGGQGARSSFEEMVASMSIIAGTPKQVVEKLRVILEQTQPSILALWANDGRISHEDSKTCIRLLGQEVLPALREIGKGLDLRSPFELNTPVSMAFSPPPQQSPRLANRATGW
jgi:alkanesulfonate monooxygenase SsuD/methylene tetrahydromethanopterin reductase-like flavin-dependent oxidoreductase (luciferase family)